MLDPTIPSMTYFDYLTMFSLIERNTPKITILVSLHELESMITLLFTALGRYITTGCIQHVADLLNMGAAASEF